MQGWPDSVAPSDRSSLETGSEKLAIIRRSVVTVAALTGLVATSQAPEFAQQYRQRLGGAVEELRTVAENFDKDAESSNLSREEAIRELRRSNNRFSRDRGTSMASTLERYDGLTSQQNAMERAGPLLRPIQVLRSPDTKIVSDAWEKFEPAVPITPAGMIWGVIGALLGGGFAGWLGRLFGRGNGRQKEDWPLPKPVRTNLAAPRIDREIA